VPEVPGQQLALAALDELHRHVRVREEGELPVLVLRARGEPGLVAEARRRVLQHGEVRHLVRVLRGVGVRGAPAVVVADERHGAEVEPLHQGADVGGERALVVRARRDGRPAGPALVGRDHRVLLGERGDDGPPVVRVLRPAVQQHDWAAGAGPEVVQAHVAHLGGVLLDEGGHSVLRK
jgi:hypothetical protein